jgi:Mg-chelatase subunit ChlD
MPNEGRREQALPAHVRGLTAVATTAGAVAIQMAAGALNNPVVWLLVGLGTVLGQVTASGLDRLFGWVRRLKARVVVFVAVAVVVTSLVTGGAWLFGPPLVAGAKVLLDGCPQPVEVRVLVSPDTIAPFREIAADYERHTARPHGCRTANLYLYPLSAQQAANAFAESWPDATLSKYGPRPDVWLPDSSVEVDEVRADAAKSTVPMTIGEGRSAAWSPLVLGVPASVVERLDAGGDPQERTWSAQLKVVRDNGLGVVRPDVTGSMEGEFAAHALYGPVGPEDFGVVREVEQQVARSLDAGGYPLADTPALLGRHRAIESPRTAVVASEQALLRFNQAVRFDQGRPLPGCDEPEAPPSCLVVSYPSDTVVLDYPVVPVSWHDRLANPPAQGEVARFDDWLRTSDGQDSVNRAGLRAPGHAATGPFNGKNGVRQGFRQDGVRPKPTPEQRDALLDAYAAAKRPGRVMLALDASGSMNEPAGTGGTRFAVATSGVKQALTFMAEKDEFGLSVFSGQDGGVRELVPLGPKNGTARAESVLGALGAVAPEGATPLYRAIVDGVGAVGAASADSLTAVIVLTDGDDTTSGISSAQLVDSVRGKGVRVFVLAVGEARCAARELVEVTTATSGLCRDSTSDTVGDDLAALFRKVWSVTG